jgi:acyl-coenzyme A synthetase/AMP-(fatty) acid ligase
VIELVERAAAAHPERPAVVTHDATVSYGELRAMAYAAAAGLAERGWSRVATVEPDAATVVALLAGASAVGTEVCQYPPADPEDVPGLAERFDHAVVLCADAGLDAGAATVVPPAALLGGLDTASPRGSAGSTTKGDGHSADDAGHSTTDQAGLAGRAGLARDEPSRVETTEDAVRPHLVLTTGTTGAPRGVRHDWNRLLRGVARVQPAQDERWLLAYGLHQFAGLQILLHVLAAGATLVAPAPRRPQQGLAAMRALGVTHASATPTYWRFLLAEMRSDGGPVPALRQLTLGGEAIPGPLLERLRATFPDARVSQIYAASEFGSTGSVRDGRAGLSADVLRRGDDADVAMRIVDGELWVRSRTGMLGYYGEPPVDPDAWRPTGDLVEEVDGRIEFRGRSSEVINVGGVKVHPLPVEERIGAIPDVAVARVWGRPNAMTGTIVAVDVVPAGATDHAGLKAAVKEACADLPPAAQPRSIRIVDEITTQGDKIVRQA